jgi:ABC-type arginine transport system ATPase subunit
MIPELELPQAFLQLTPLAQRWPVQLAEDQQQEVLSNVQGLRSKHLLQTALLSL